MSDETSTLDVPQWLVLASVAAGALEEGWFRVFVLSMGGAVSHRDFEDFVEAKRYADDAASEGDAPIATICDAALNVVGQGRHFASRG